MPPKTPVTPTALYDAWDRFQAAATAALVAETDLRPMLEACPSWPDFQSGLVSLDAILVDLVHGQDWPDRPRTRR